MSRAETACLQQSTVTKDLISQSHHFDSEGLTAIGLHRIEVFLIIVLILVSLRGLMKLSLFMISILSNTAKQLLFINVQSVQIKRKHKFSSQPIVMIFLN